MPIPNRSIEFKRCGQCRQTKSLDNFGRQCNIALGKFKEDVVILESAIAYLKRCV